MADFNIDDILDQLGATDLSMTTEEAKAENVPTEGPRSLAETDMPEPEEPDLSDLAPPPQETPPQSPAQPAPATPPSPPDAPPAQEAAPAAPEPLTEVPEWTDGTWEDYLGKVPTVARKAMEGLKGQVDRFQANEKSRMDSFLVNAEKVIGAFAEARGLEVEPVMAQVQAVLKGVMQAEVDQAEQRESTTRLYQQNLTTQLQLLAYQDQSYAQSCQRNSPQDQATRKTMADILTEAGRLGRNVNPQQAWQIARAQHNLVFTSPAPAASAPAPTRPAPIPPPPVATRTPAARNSAPPVDRSRRPLEVPQGASVEDVLARAWNDMFK
jgi:hypothetical protein